MGAVQEANKLLIQRWIGPADEGSGPFLLSDAALGLLMEDAVWHLPPTAEIPGVEDSRVVRGRESIQAIQRRAGEIYDVATIEVEIRKPACRRRLGRSAISDALPRGERQPV